VAISLRALACVYTVQKRYKEAEPLYRRALEIYENARGPEQLDVAICSNNVGNVLKWQRRSQEAMPFYQRALAIREKLQGQEHLDLAPVLNNLADANERRRHYAEAEPLYQRALAIHEKTFGRDHPGTAADLHELAQLYYDQRRYADAEPLADRALAIRDRAQVGLDTRFDSYYLRARIAWQLDRRSEALADLKRAMDLAEQQRGHSSGAEHERAELFSRFAGAFERMVAWQTQLGDVGEALDAIERGRARSLLDEMNLGGADLEPGRPAVEREKLKAREVELKARIASLEQQLDAAGPRPAQAAQTTTPQDPERLRKELAEARQQLYDHYRQARSTSPVYRNLLSVGAGRPRLSQIQRRLVAGGGLLLVYLFGENGGYLLAIHPEAARLESLQVGAEGAKTLGIEPGPLTAKRLQAALITADGTGVLQQLADARKALQAGAKLAVLWEVLVPQAERDQIAGGKIKRLIVVPDGLLALLPFESLVVKPAAQSPSADSPARALTYLLDVGPPVAYAPSTTVLFNLLERPAPAPGTQREPVLTVGNPSYAPEGPQVASAGEGTLGQLAARSRYRSMGGKLTALPYSGWESGWVVESFDSQGIRSARLDGPAATEAGVRAQVAGRRIVHLACHGLTDQSFGNFYGALALSPGPDSTRPDDGFLTLAEIYALNLHDCELAILSACETNYGPEQQGEGVWALSRGFLVAGSRRVVASNWLVDDQAAASLVSYFCSGLTTAEKEGKPPDYGAAPQAAKRWVRQQEKWSSPYYWATFVLVGPN